VPLATIRWNARTAVASGADYVAFGSFFPRRSSPMRPRGGFAAHAAKSALNVFHGRDRRHHARTAPALIAAGADALAVVTALFDAPRRGRGGEGFRDAFDCHDSGGRQRPNGLNGAQSEAGTSERMSRNDELLRRAQRRSQPASILRARVSLVGGTPRFFHAAAKVPTSGCRRQALHRLRGLVGAAILGHAHADTVRRGAGDRAPTACRSRADGSRDRDRRDALRPAAVARAGAVGEFGTEATMSALRLARGYTGRSKIVKFEAAITATRQLAA